MTVNSQDLQNINRLFISALFFVYENGNIERLDDEFNKFMSGNFMICKYAGVHSIKFGFYSDRIMVCNYIIATLINHPASKTEYETAIIMWCQVSILFHNVFKLFFLTRWFWSHPILYRRYWNFMVIHSLRGNNLSCETFQTGHMISPPKRTKFSQKNVHLQNVHTLSRRIQK